eukprot:5463171-Heterocapsa_arctica.AAC.1
MADWPVLPPFPLASPGRPEASALGTRPLPSSFSHSLWMRVSRLSLAPPPLYPMLPKMERAENRLVRLPTRSEF